jgi:hypothetical protein
MSNVIAAYPYGDKGTVEVFTKKADALTEKAAKKAISTKKNFKLVAFEKKVLGQVKSD